MKGKGTATGTAIAPRPWHLIPQDVRERSAIANCEVDGDEGHTCGGPFGMIPQATECDCAARSEAFRAAAQALRDAAPYPDEVLAFVDTETGWHVELMEVDDEADGMWMLNIPDEDGHWMWRYPGELMALTVAAHELLTGGVP